MIRYQYCLLALVMVLGLMGCQSPTTTTAAIELSAPLATAVLPTPTLPPTATATNPPPIPPTAVPTSAPSPTPPATATPPPTPTATPIGPCDQRFPGDTLLPIVTTTYGLSRDFVPGDLVPLSDYLPVEVTLGYPTEVRQVIIQPLVNMIRDMQTDGLKPIIVSGYRSYSVQAIAYQKWQEQYPDRAQILSAPPGFSEHQLGTTIDFSSPELADITGDDSLQFHTSFYQTSEGQWLLENAHRFGFTLSYPRDAFDLTGFYYEPWHYRYVGVELATLLRELNMFLSEFQFETQPLPCLP